MVDIDRIKDDYEKLKQKQLNGLLSLEKVIELENFKDWLINNRLIKIKKVTTDFLILIDEDFIQIEDIISQCKMNFGDANFVDKRNENNKIIIDVAFHFCILSLSCNNGIVKYKVNIFWDV